MKLWDRKTFMYAMTSALAWGITHLYAFMRLMVSHDSLSEFFAGAVLPNGYTVIDWKIALGRFMIPVYQKLFRGTVTAPWLIGMLFVLFLGFAVYVYASVFSLKRGLSIFLMAGILATNPAVFAATATFINDLDCYMLALLMSGLAALCWKRDKPLFWLAGVFFVSMCMGFYACYLSFAIMAVMFISILDLLDHERTADVLIRGLKAIAMFLAGVALYMLMLKTVSSIADVQLVEEDYNSITNLMSQTTRENLFERSVIGYQQVWQALSRTLFGHGNSVNVLSLAVLLGGLAVLAVRMVRGRIPVCSALLTLLLLALMPIAMDLSMIAGSGWVHDLMKCAFAMVYLLVLLLIDPMLYMPGKAKRAAAAILALGLGLMSWNYVVQANQIYVKKDLERQYTASTMTRIMTQLEQREDYIPAQTTLLFAGDMNHQVKMRGELVAYWAYTGVSSSSPIQNWRQHEPYLEYMMGIDVAYCGAEQRWALVSSQQVKDMPIYPAEGSIQMIDDVLVVKVGPVE